jgi:hypothetical protein
MLLMTIMVTSIGRVIHRVARSDNAGKNASRYKK